MKKLFVKASGVIHITHNISLVQYRLWNFLLAHAHPELGTKDKYQVSTAKLIKVLNIKSNR